MKTRNRVLRFLIGAALLGALTPVTMAQQKACCSVTGVTASSGLVRARENATGRTFEFRVPNAAFLQRLSAGMPVFANFGSKQVSLDGRTVCCQIVSISAGAAAPPQSNRPAPGVAGAAAPSSAPTASSQKPATPLGAAARNVQAEPVKEMPLPEAAVGQPQYPSGQQGFGGHAAAQRGSLSASNVNKDVVHLAGIEGIEKANIPEGAKNLLIMHVMTLPPEESDHYIVNTKLAEQWMKDHPAPASTKKHVGAKHSGCHALSMHCAGEAAKHAQDEAGRQSEKLRQQAGDEWRHVSLEAAHDWKMAEDCMADKTLHLSDLPVEFSISPGVQLDLERSKKIKDTYGTASGKVKGVLNINFPLQGKFKARVDMFYIPCLPFAVRPKKIGAGGWMQAGTKIGAGFTATGQFEQSFKLPPSGEYIPIEVLPIVIGGVPVAELDAGIYLDGTIEVGGEGKFDAQFKLDAEHRTEFDFECEGKGCRFNSHSDPVPSTTSEAVKLNGRVYVKPAVYAALQLDFDVNALTARAGPEPYLYGEVSGCIAAAAQQSTMAATTVQQSDALTADLDWGMTLRAEALAFNKMLGGAKINLLKNDVDPVTHRQHLYFKDLIGSTGLVPMLEAGAQPVAGKTVAYRMKMPTCYPYRDPVEYRVKWTGQATASNVAGGTSSASTAGGSPSRVTPTSMGMRSSAASTSSAAGSTGLAACTWQGNEGDCWGDPVKGLVFGLDWAAAGSQTLSATPVRDKHGRVFPDRTAQVGVSVQ